MKRTSGGLFYVTPEDEKQAEKAEKKLFAKIETLINKHMEENDARYRAILAKNDVKPDDMQKALSNKHKELFAKCLELYREIYIQEKADQDKENLHP